MSTARRPIEIVRAEDHHAEALAQFIRQVWTPSATAEGVVAARRLGATQNVASPGEPLPTWIAIQSGKVIGYVTTLAIRLSVRGAEVPAYWIKGLMVLPEYRNGPIGYHVLKAASASLPRSAGLAVAAPALRLFEALGYRNLGRVPNWVRPLAPGRIFQRVDLALLGPNRLPSWAASGLRWARAAGAARAGGWIVRGGLRLAAGTMRMPAWSLAVEACTPESVADELDGLWAQVRPGLPCTVVRNREYLLARYGSGTEPYRWIVARRDGRLSGVAVLRQPGDQGDPRLQGIRLAVLADLILLPQDTTVGLALLGGVERIARQLGADAILASGAHPSLQDIFRRQCYLRLPGNVALVVRDVNGDPRLPDSLLEWWLTRGDGLADEAF